MSGILTGFSSWRCEYCEISASPLWECTRFILFLGCNFMFFGTKEEIVLALARSGFRSKKLQSSCYILVSKLCGGGMVSKIVEYLLVSAIIQLSPSSLTRNIFGNIFATYVI